MRKSSQVLLNFLILVSFGFFAYPVNAVPMGGEQVVAQQRPPCPGVCRPSPGGAGVCPAGTVVLVHADPDKRYDCPETHTCCKGTPEGATAGSGATSACPAGQSYTKVGVGSVRCGENQCRPQGYLWFTDCLSENDCAVNRGTTDGGNVAGCSEGQYCCRMKKNRCNDASTDPNKVYVCTSESSCTAKGGKVMTGGFGCNEGGSYSKCCEFSDSIESAMLNAGEPLQGLGGSTGGRATQVSRVPRKYQNINAFCFTELECAKASAPGAWVKGNGCTNKGNTPQGYCKAPPPQYDLQYPLGGVKTIGDLKSFIGLIFNYAMSIIVIVAAVIFLYGGFRYMFAAVSDDVQVGKTIMVDSVIGLTLGLAAYAIMANVNFNTVNLRSFDVFMINKLSFYDNVYCSDIKPENGKSEVKFQDAGTPFAPEELNISKGYPLTLSETKCGHEYFIEGGDSLSICTALGCGKGLCLNCASGSRGCKSDSEKEHVCFDANIGGTIVFPSNKRLVSNAGNRKMQAFAFCEQGSGLKFEQLGEAEITDKNIGSGAANGAIATYAIKLNLEKVKDFKKSCSGKAGVVLEHHINTGVDTSGPSVVIGLGHWYYYLSKSCSFNYEQTEMFTYTKAFSMPTLSISGAFDKMSAEKRRALLDNAWPIDDIISSDKSPIRCNATLEIPSNVTGNETNRHG